MRPGVHGAHHLSSLLRVGAIGLSRTVVTDLGFAPVADQASLVVHLAPEKGLVLRADPGVGLVVVGEPRGAVTLRAVVRVAGQKVESE
jgi:hypothetical protein